MSKVKTRTVTCPECGVSFRTCLTEGEVTCSCGRRYSLAASTDGRSTSTRVDSKTTQAHPGNDREPRPAAGAVQHIIQGHLSHKAGME